MKMETKRVEYGALARAGGMTVIAIALACAFANVASAAGNAKTYDPVAQDPVITDKAPPPLVHEVRFDSDGVTLYGKVFSVQGTSPRPTVVIARGYPDMTSSADLALILQRAGYNAMIFNYRGTWGMGGSFSLENAYQDMHAAVEYLREAQNTKSMLVDPNNIVLLGYSLGAPVALRLAASDAGVRGVMQLDGTDMRAMAALTPEQRAEWAADLKTPAVPNADGMKIIGDVVDRFDNWNPETYVPGLSGKDVLLLWASQGNGSEMHRWGKSLHDMYSGPARVMEKTFETNHDFADHRIELARVTLAWLDKLHYAPASFTQKAEPDESRRIAIAPEQLEKYVGVYKDATSAPFYLKVEDGKLMQGDAERQWRPVDAYDNKTFSLNSDRNQNCDSFTFNQDEKGIVASVTLQCQGHNVTLKRTSTELDFPSEPQMVTVSANVLKTYVGKYRLPLKFQPSSYFNISLKGDQLIVTPEGNTPFMLYPTSNTKFFSRVVVADVEFVKDDAGAISHIHAKMNDGEYDFPREQ
jgi:dienelactone hydrolase